MRISLRQLVIRFTVVICGLALVLPALRDTLDLCRSRTQLQKAGGKWIDRFLPGEYLASLDGEYGSAAYSPPIEMLRLPANALDEETLRAIREIGEFEGLELTGGMPEPEAIGEVVRASRLRMLELHAKEELPSEVVRNLQNFPHLRELVLHNVTLSKEAIDALAAMQQLSLLMLYKTSITRRDALTLKERMTNTLIIAPYEYFLDDENYDLVRAIRRAGGDVSVDYELRIYQVRLRSEADELLRRVSLSKDFSSDVATLDLRSADVTGSGLKVVGAFRAIQEVDLRSTHVSANVAQELSRRCNCKVKWSAAGLRK